MGLTFQVSTLTAALWGGKEAPRTKAPLLQASTTMHSCLCLSSRHPDPLHMVCLTVSISCLSRDASQTSELGAACLEIVPSPHGPDTRHTVTFPVTALVTEAVTRLRSLKYLNLTAHGIAPEAALGPPILSTYFRYQCFSYSHFRSRSCSSVRWLPHHLSPTPR